MPTRKIAYIRRLRQPQYLTSNLELKHPFTIGFAKEMAVLMQTVKVCQFSNNWGDSGSLYT